jgi:hypothetical protein
MKYKVSSRIGTLRLPGLLLLQLLGPTLVWADKPADPGGMPGRIATLEAAVAALTNRVATLESELVAANAVSEALQRDLDAVKNNTVLALDGKVTLGDSEGDGLPEVVFTGVNVQIVNGLGPAHTWEEALTPVENGLGNLILGYNERVVAPCEGCQGDGTGNQIIDPHEPVALPCTGCPEEPNPDRAGSHNLVIGPGHRYTQVGGLVAGFANWLYGNFATAIGYRNTAYGAFSSVTAGFGNTAWGNVSSVTGGANNFAAGIGSSISGGYLNTAGDQGGSEEAYQSISGGNNIQWTRNYGWAAGTFRWP